MSWAPQAAWAGLTSSPLFGLTLTLLAYEVSVRIWRRCGRRAVANPVLMSIVLIGSTLAVLHVSYENYLTGGRFISILLGPATVALALPLYRQSDTIRRAAGPIILGILIGASAAVASALLVTRWSGGQEVLARSLAPKSATTPIAIVVADQIGGIPALTAVFTILTGVLGAVAAPAILSAVRIRDPRARGLAIGISSHGIGTARALEDDPASGAFAGLAMALSAVVTPLAVPVVLAALGMAAHLGSQ